MSAAITRSTDLVFPQEKRKEVGKLHLDDAFKNEMVPQAEEKSSPGSASKDLHHMHRTSH
jgi:hypothetical protein